MIRTVELGWPLASGGSERGFPHSRKARYPDKPVRFIVGFTAGSATDITARLFAQKFAEAWNVPVTVENVPGAGGSVGGDRVGEIGAGRHHVLLGRQRRADHQSDAADQQRPTTWCAISRRSRGF